MCQLWAAWPAPSLQAEMRRSALFRRLTPKASMTPQSKTHPLLQPFQDPVLCPWSTENISHEVINSVNVSLNV